MMSNIYNRSECATFRKTKDTYGGLSNMAAGYPIFIGPYKFHTNEHLYQSMKFIHNPEIQLEIAKPVSPMACKMIAKKYEESIMKNWVSFRIEVMRWCAKLKLLQNEEKFGDLLKSTGTMDIVEDSYKDVFWGAKPKNDTLVGLNVLGEILRKVRNEYVKGGIEAISSKPNIETIRLLFNSEDVIDLLAK
jgi:ribA/ribD-fused uncharacterized protein